MNDIKAFFHLQQPFWGEDYRVYGSARWYNEYGRAEWSDDVTSESIRCPVYPGHQRAGERIGNLVVVLPSRKTGDFVWTWYSDCLIADRVLYLFQEAGFTGFDVKPVTVKWDARQRGLHREQPVLWELVVTGKGGDADPRSGIRLIYSCPHCNLTRYSSFGNGIIVDEQAWDGSDFFTVTGYPRYILISERVKELVIRNALTNCALVPAQDLRWKSLTRPEDHYGQKE